MLLKKYMK